MPRTVTVAGSWPTTGWVLLQPVDPESLPNVGTIAAVVEAELDNGALPAGTTVVIPDSEQEPVLFDVRVLLDGLAPTGSVYPIPVGATAINLANLVPIPVWPAEPGQPDPGYPGVYPVVTWDHVGVAGGVAPLGLDRKVPAAYLPAASGGSVPGTVLHIQMTPAASWFVTHGLNTYPQVILLDDTGARLLSDLEYPDINSIVLTHAVPMAGTAIALG